MRNSRGILIALSETRTFSPRAMDIVAHRCRGIAIYIKSIRAKFAEHDNMTQARDTYIMNRYDAICV